MKNTKFNYATWYANHEAKVLAVITAKDGRLLGWHELTKAQQRDLEGNSGWEREQTGKVLCKAHNHNCLACRGCRKFEENMRADYIAGQELKVVGWIGRDHGMLHMLDDKASLIKVCASFSKDIKHHFEDDLWAVLFTCAEADPRLMLVNRARMTRTDDENRLVCDISSIEAEGYPKKFGVLVVTLGKDGRKDAFLSCAQHLVDREKADEKNSTPSR